MANRFQVKQNGDGIGYYVAEMVPGIGEMWIKGCSLNRQEMIDLALKLNQEAAE